MPGRCKKVLVILDVLKDYSDPQSPLFIQNSGDVLKFIQGELDYFRQRDRSVIFCNTTATECPLASSAIKNCTPVTCFKARANEYSIFKTRANAFYKTSLHDILKKVDAYSLNIVGFMSHTSVLLTAASALDLGYKVVIPQTCIASKDAANHYAALKLLESWLRNDQMLI